MVEGPASYSGDVSRKRKFLNKHKEGKKRMHRFGKVDIPQAVFIEALKIGGHVTLEAHGELSASG